MAQASIAEPNDRIQETQFASEEPDENHQGLHINGNGYGTTEAVSAHSLQNNTEAAKKPATGATRALGPDLLRGLLMVLQAIDHSAVSTGAWRHGTALESEGDGIDVDTWNNNTGWTARMFTHLCAPGFMFLLGMGVVYWGQSRSRLGWSAWRMILHYFIRALVLAIVNEVLGLVIARGRFLVLNIVLLALAVNYFLAGLLWLAITASEQALSRVTASDSTASSSHGQESQPLLQRLARSGTGKTSSIAWHAHNILLLVIAVVTIWWNVWLSRDHGHCTGQSSQVMDIGSAAIGGKSTNLAFDFWFYSVQTAYVVSPFPPLAWLSFAIIGMLYARVVLVRPWKPSSINCANAAVAVAFAILFVVTRLANFGNLSEGCLHMPEHEAHPDKNQYLTSFKAFFYVIKYPPDPAYLAYTLSVNFFLLAFFGGLPPRVAHRIPALMTFGTSALFFYVLHLLIYSGLAVLVKTWFGHPLRYTDPFTQKPAVGIGNSPVYWVTWLLGLAVLYPACRWYSRFKSEKPPDSVWRFF